MFKMTSTISMACLCLMTIGGVTAFGGDAHGMRKVVPSKKQVQRDKNRLTIKGAPAHVYATRSRSGGLTLREDSSSKGHHVTRGRNGTLTERDGKAAHSSSLSYYTRGLDGRHTERDNRGANERRRIITKGANGRLTEREPW